MPSVSTHLVDVYPYRSTPDGFEFLLLKRSPGRIYEGHWRMVGGKISKGETAWEAALRELREEIGQVPSRFWSVPSVNTFYEASTDRLHLIPAFAAQINHDPVLNHEHDRFVWLPAEQAAGRLVWPEQQRLLLLVSSLLESNTILPDWTILPPTG